MATEPNSTKLSRILAKSAREMRETFEKSREIQHSGEKGTVREKILARKFLQTYLPDTVRVSESCEIVDVNGSTSSQIDIALYDPSAPPLYSEEDFRIFPSECVYATIEIKSKLDGDEFRKSIDQGAAIKRLRKTAYGKPLLIENTRTQYGKTWDYCPTMSFIFAYDSIDLDTLAGIANEKYANLPLEQRIDAVWVLGRGYLSWYSVEDDAIRVCPSPGDQLAVQDVVEGTQDVLLCMVLMLNEVLMNVWMPPFKLLHYAADAPIGQRRSLWNISEP